jgi:hypothetical protein
MPSTNIPKLDLLVTPTLWLEFSRHGGQRGGASGDGPEITEPINSGERIKVHFELFID